MVLSIRCLGPFEIAVGGEAIPVIGARRVSLLARLAMEPGLVVTADQLVADVWGDSVTATAGKQLHIVVSKLRELLAPYHGSELIVTASRGYRLELPGEQVDTHLFASLVKRARAAQAQNELAAADAFFRRALSLWRGQALADVAGAWVRSESARLEEERLSAVEDHVGLRLAGGDHHMAVPELIAHIAAAPLRERPRAQLMLALYRSGRVPEALAVYQDTRRVLVEELGIEPGPALQRLHRAVLAHDPALDLGEPVGRAVLGQAVVPAELPADTRAFTGRTAELAWLHRLLTGQGGAPVVAAIDGPGGIGKSALAVRAAHAVAGRFADGVLYVDLLGSTAGRQPMAPAEALGRMLRSLGLAGTAVPTDPQEAAARYRSLTAARNLLIVLDNALDARQVRPLLPAGPGCVVITTSRQAMTSLDVASHLHLTGLRHQEGMELLSRVAGADRVAAEPEAAAQIVRLCDALPLALRIAAARLAARPDWTLTHLAGQLADATRRLDALEHDDLAVRASITVGQAHLAADPAALFPLLGLLDSSIHTAASAGALAGWFEPRAETALEALLAARLLEPAGLGRHRMHDLLRLHAREQAEQIDQAVQTGAIRRALLHYVAAADAACLLIDSSLHSLRESMDLPEVAIATLREANDWLSAERDNLLQLARQAVNSQHPEVALALNGCLTALFWRRGWFGELAEVCESALELAVRRGDLPGQARLLTDLGYILAEQGRHTESVEHLERALNCWDKAGLPLKKAGTYNDLGITYTMMGRYDEALSALAASQSISQQTGLREKEAVVLNNRVHVYYRQGRFEEAIEEARTALDMCPDPTGPGAATSHDTLADAYRAAGRLAEAESAYRTAIELQGEAELDFGTALSHWWLGRTLHDLGRRTEARLHWRQSLDLLLEAGLSTPEEAGQLLEDENPAPPFAVKNHI
ncbi:AfsR/SARP family transcriptional regulator [Nonomuraea basaltis]|uniref:AfsR/SARP family transcriptional regulator n=1 Tax=Nonomuraea basaltis TaxID=2495887 RepID=UPI0014866A3F|nr:BTAD domain-containing putative transcriptional regulator [Nonomuraea basaltis]